MNMAFNQNESPKIPTKHEYYRDPNQVEFNLLKATPVEAWFDIKVEDFKEICIKFLNNYIGGVNDFRYIVDKQTGEVSWYAYFDKHSEHFYDKSTRQSGLGVSIKKKSEKFIKFCKAYGWSRLDENINIDVSEKEREKLGKVNLNEILISTDTTIAVRIGISKIILVLFDAENEEFTKRYGTKKDPIEIGRQHIYDWNYRKRSEDGQNKNSNHGILLTQPEWIKKCTEEGRFKAFPREVYGVRVYKKIIDINRNKFKGTALEAMQ